MSDGKQIATAADRMSELIGGVDPSALDRPTPCAGTSVGDLLDHIGGLSLAFTAAARKEPAGRSGPPPAPDGANLAVDWKDDFPKRLDALGHAWADPAAWEGMSSAGGLEMPAEVTGLVALDELLIHGWDLARATDQPYRPDDASLETIKGWIEEMLAQGFPRDGIFGPPVEVPASAPLLDRVVGLTGRDPSWSPA
jgi:uncharacterized protein (TIGR03086 family)